MLICLNVLLLGTTSWISKIVFVFDRAIIAEGFRPFNIVLLSKGWVKKKKTGINY